LDDLNFLLGTEYGRTPIDTSSCAAETIDQLIDDLHVQFILGGMPAANYAPGDSWCVKLKSIASEINNDKVPGTAYIDEFCCPYPTGTCTGCPGGFSLSEPYVDISGFGFLNGSGSKAILQWALSKINGRHKLGAHNGLSWAGDGLEECRHSVRYIFDDGVPVEDQQIVDIQIGMAPSSQEMRVMVYFLLDDIADATRTYAKSGNFLFLKDMTGGDCTASNEFELEADLKYGGVTSASIGDPTMPLQPSAPGGNPELWAANVPGDAVNPEDTPSHDSRPVLDLWVSPI
jgi:hypothetical protein